MTAAEIGVLSLRVLFGSVGVAVACLLALATWVVVVGAWSFWSAFTGGPVRSQSPAVEVAARLLMALRLFWTRVRGEVQ